MAKLQLLAITTLDGYLFDRTVSSPLWDNPNKYGLTKIRERATQTLGPDVSFISLTQWKKKNEGIYFIEAAPDTISVISSMFRYWLVDEIILFVAPYIQGDGIRLFTEMKVCRNTRCAFFFFIDYKNRLIFLSCDILRISLVYVFATSK